MHVQDGWLVVKVGKRKRQLTPKRLFLELEDGRLRAVLSPRDALTPQQCRMVGRALAAEWEQEGHRGQILESVAQDGAILTLTFPRGVTVGELRGYLEAFTDSVTYPAAEVVVLGEGYEGGRVLLPAAREWIDCPQPVRLVARIGRHYILPGKALLTGIRVLGAFCTRLAQMEEVSLFYPQGLASESAWLPSSVPPKPWVHVSIDDVMQAVQEARAWIARGGA